MGLINQKQRLYYQNKRDHGNYQFTSLKDVINQFMVAYVGEDKIISRVNKTDIQFHAMRALQELSFDTFKSCKTQEITMPSSLQMILPHDYVNYVKLTWSDDSGIEHLMYPTSKTSNPYTIVQQESGDYSFTPGLEYAFNADFSEGDDGMEDWIVGDPISTRGIRVGGMGTCSNSAYNDNQSTCLNYVGTCSDPTYTNQHDCSSTSAVNASTTKFTADGVVGSWTTTSTWTTTTLNQVEDTISAESQVLKFRHHVATYTTYVGSAAYSVHKELDVTDVTLLNLQATGLSAEKVYQQRLDNEAYTNGDWAHEGGIIRIGCSSMPPDTGRQNGIDTGGAVVSQTLPNHYYPGYFDLGYLEWSDGTGIAETKLLENEDAIDVSAVNTAYLTIVSIMPYERSPQTVIGTSGTCLNNSTYNDNRSQCLANAPGRKSWFWSPTNKPSNLSGIADSTLVSSVNEIDDISIRADASVGQLQTTPSGRSATWDNFKSHKRAENNINDYQDYQNHGYWPNIGQRYGLDPQHAQTNGSFFIDCHRGKIFFSSNISGKTVILEYISDSLGTDEEMKVHKFAEEAMYKWIMHAVLSTRSQVPEYQVARYKKEKRAAIRQAKLRLSNIKLEEITQIFRGKSKQIKH